MNKSEHCCPPIYLGVGVWGERYCREFMDFCIGSLVASGNIPALPNEANQNKFLFFTSFKDWEIIRSHPNFKLLEKHITPQQVSIELSGQENNIDGHFSRWRLITNIHLKMVSMMYSAGCIGGVVFPDTIYSYNSLSSAYSMMVENSKKAVVTYLSRFCTPQLLVKLDELGYIRAGQPLEIKNRDLVKVALQQRNSENINQEWSNLYALDFATEICWPLSHQNGIVSHSYMWHPVFIDYSKMSHHDTNCLENNTIDGKYLYKNFVLDDLYIISDSDLVAMISYSPHTDFVTKNKLFNAHDKISHFADISYRMKDFVDPLKKELLRVPFLLHVRDSGRKDLQLIRQAGSIIDQIVLQWDEKIFEESARD